MICDVWQNLCIVDGQEMHPAAKEHVAGQKSLDGLDITIIANFDRLDTLA